jgi:hypothetical protein
MLEELHNAKGVEVVFEALSKLPHETIQLIFSGVREGRVADVMSERKRFCQILIQTERGSDSTRDLGHFDGVGQAVAKVIREALREDLGLVLQAPESAGMHDAVAVSLKIVSVGMGKFGVAAAACPLHWKAQMSERGRRHFF